LLWIGQIYVLFGAYLTVLGILIRSLGGSGVTFAVLGVYHTSGWGKQRKKLNQMVCNKMGQWLMVALGCLYGHINFRVNAIKKEGGFFFCFLLYPLIP
jgi:hypothetical protein